MIRYRVIVSNGHEIYYGTMSWEYPVDEPPVVEANGKRLCRWVWEERGFTIEHDLKEVSVPDESTHLSVHEHNAQNGSHLTACCEWVHTNYTLIASETTCAKCLDTSKWRCAADPLASVIEPLIQVTDDETAGNLDTCESAMEIAEAIRSAGWGRAS